MIEKLDQTVTHTSTTTRTELTIKDHTIVVVDHAWGDTYTGDNTIQYYLLKDNKETELSIDELKDLLGDDYDEFSEYVEEELYD